MAGRHSAHPYPGRLIIIADARGRILYEREPFSARLFEAKAKHGKENNDGIHSGGAGRQNTKKLPGL